MAIRHLRTAFASQYQPGQPLEAGYSVVPEQYVGPVSCYRTIGYADCHAEPLTERRHKYGTYYYDPEGAEDRAQENSGQIIPGLF